MPATDIKSIIHIGYPKTGTTWFQQELFPKAKNGYFIHHSLVKEHIISPYEFDYKPTNDFLKDLAGRNIIISEENLIGSIQDGGMYGLHTKEMAHRLKVLFPSGKIILFLRNQVSAIASGYVQYIKMGGNYSVKKYLFDKNYEFTARRRLFQFDFFKFDKVVELYNTLFGEDNVYVYLYEDFAKNPKEFIADFVETHKLEVNLSGINFSPVNQRFNRSLILVSRVLNSFTKRPLFYKYYLIHIPFWYYIALKIQGFLSKFIFFGKKQTDEQILGKKTCDYIKMYYSQSNLRLAALIGKREKMKAYGYL